MLMLSVENVTVGVSSPLRTVTVAGVRIVNAAAFSHLRSSVLPSMSVSVICSSLNPDTSIALIRSLMPSVICVPVDSNSTVYTRRQTRTRPDLADVVPALASQLGGPFSTSLESTNSMRVPTASGGETESRTSSPISVSPASLLRMFSSLAAGAPGRSILPPVSRPTSAVTSSVFPLANWMLVGSNLKVGVRSSSLIVTVSVRDVAVSFRVCSAVASPRLSSSVSDA